MSKSEKSIAEQILEILKETSATVKDFSETLDVSENIIRTTINRMKKRNLIQETGVFRDRFKIYRIGGLSELEIIKTDDLGGIEREILKKMLLPFARSGIKMRFTPEEQNRVKELFSQTYNSKGERTNGL